MQDTQTDETDRRDRQTRQTDETDRQTRRETDRQAAAGQTDRRTGRIPAQGMEFHRTTDSQTARQTVEYLFRLTLCTQEDVCTDRRKHLQRRK